MKLEDRLREAETRLFTDCGLRPDSLTWTWWTPESACESSALARVGPWWCFMG